MRLKNLTREGEQKKRWRRKRRPGVGHTKPRGVLLSNIKNEPDPDQSQVRAQVSRGNGVGRKGCLGGGIRKRWGRRTMRPQRIAVQDIATKQREEKGKDIAAPTTKEEIEKKVMRAIELAGKKGKKVPFQVTIGGVTSGAEKNRKNRTGQGELIVKGGEKRTDPRRGLVKTG